jgi:ATP-dependent RNA helicase RhlE
MLDMGFIRDIRSIVALLPERRQNLLFSATFSEDIRRLAAGLLHEPAQVQVSVRNSAVDLVRQVVYPVDRARKTELLSHLIRSGRIDRALVFTRTKHGADRLAHQLERDGIAAAAIHGNKSQGQRVRALDAFKGGRVAILVATEVAARGLDIDALPHVVNYELPMVAQDYVHRIGRTGRAGMEGDAVSLVCVDEEPLLRDIQALLRTSIPRETVDGFAVDRSIRAEAIPMRSRGRSFGNQGGGFAPARRPGGHPASAGGNAKDGFARRGGARPRRGGGRPVPQGGQPSGGRRWGQAATGTGIANRPVTQLPGERLARGGPDPR